MKELAFYQFHLYLYTLPSAYGCTQYCFYINCVRAFCVQLILKMFLYLKTLVILKEYASFELSKAQFYQLPKYIKRQILNLNTSRANQNSLSPCLIILTLILYLCIFRN